MHMLQTYTAWFGSPYQCDYHVVQTCPKSTSGQLQEFILASLCKEINWTLTGHFQYKHQHDITSSCHHDSVQAWGRKYCATLSNVESKIITSFMQFSHPYKVPLKDNRHKRIHIWCMECIVFLIRSILIWAAAVSFSSIFSKHSSFINSCPINSSRTSVSLCDLLCSPGADWESPFSSMTVNFNVFLFCVCVCPTNYWTFHPSHPSNPAFQHQRLQEITEMFFCIYEFTSKWKFLPEIEKKNW